MKQLICRFWGHRPQIKKAGPLTWVFCLRCDEVVI